jgi:hypothetical protein
VRRFIAVHDEIQASRGQNGHPFLVHGVLFIPHERIDYVVSKLVELRAGDTQTWIEHRQIKEPRGNRYLIAERWLHWFKTEGLAFCSFKVFAVDQDGFQKFPYPGEDHYPFHIWKNTLTTFVAGIQWSLPRVKGILLDVICDSSGNADFLAAVESLPRSLNRDMIARRRRQREQSEKSERDGKHRPLRLAPLVRIRGNVKLVSSRPKSQGNDPGSHELVQLTDLLLGVLWDAVKARHVSGEGKAGRLRLSREFKEIVDPTVVVKWGTRLPLSRAMSISLYPDENKRAYPATVLTVRPGQQEMCMPEVRWETPEEKKQRRARRLELTTSTDVVKP